MSSCFPSPCPRATTLAPLLPGWLGGRVNLLAWRTLMEVSALLDELRALVADGDRDRYFTDSRYR